MDGTHGHFNINADVGASEFLFDQSFEESYIQYVPQQQMPYDMPYITTEFQPSAIASPLNGYPTRFHQRIDAYNNNSQPPAPQPSLQPNDTQLRRKRKADDDDPLPSSVRIKKEHLDTMYTAPDSSQDTNADHCTYFPEDNLKLSVDDSFQFPESFVPDKSHLLPYVGQMLMNIAHAANHEYPLLIAIDQENGMLNNLYDKAYLTQFPGNMAVVATGKKKLAKDVARAMGKELKALGINWVLGPVVDVLTNSTNRLLGVRTMGEDPEQVSDYAEAFLEGYKEAGIACCGKHFPGYGNASVNSTLDLPVVPESLQQLETASLIPYKRIIEKNVDAIMLEAISGILGGVRDEIFAEQVVIDAAKRVTDMKKRYLSWGDALAPPELSYLLELKKSHQDLSSEAYKNSVTLLRDHSNYIPLTESVEPDGNILLLTPLVSPIINVEVKDGKSEQYFKTSQDVFKKFGMTMSRYHTGKVQHTTYTAKGFQPGLFERAKAVIVVTTDADRNQYQLDFTKRISMLCNQQRKPMIAIAASSPYDLALDRAIGTYMCIYEFTQESLAVTAKILFNHLKPVGKLPGRSFSQKLKRSSSHNGRWLVEDWNEQRELPRLMELWTLCFPERRFIKQDMLFDNIFGKKGLGLAQKHFVVRNSSTREFYGFCSTWIHEKEQVGSIMMLFVIPSRRCMSIGQSLHDAAMKYLKSKNVKLIRLGSRVPQFFDGMPLSRLTQDDKPNESSRASSEHSIEESTHTGGRSGTVDLVEWFNHAGWNISAGRKSGNGAHANEVHTMKVNVENSNPRFEIPVARGFTLRPYLPEDHDQLLEFVDRHVQRRRDRAGLSLLYMQAQESQISNNSDTSILLYVDMTGRIVGSIISFSMRSNFSVLLPWIFEFENARVGGLCGLIVEQGKLLPKDVEFLKLGLVKKGLNNFIMATDLERCAISGIEGEEEYKLMKSLKFEWWKSYLEVSRKA
ncbi:hypothetical protein DV451_004129 [Geotrichum candidum]|uniref:Glycoside hydrolase family 3 N-terminal domain-containing protein n=1 Tax=Geotrichum candidum TaxID=1173061 RepID=A0A9P5G2N9_GEOCN|nr:hypothetical protein DV451_004129 [Geotrichum candidum]